MGAKILQLDQANYDLWLTYSWSDNNHGICGHTFEVIDYYFFLKDYLRVGILLAEDIDAETFVSAIEDKYDVTDQEIQDILKDTVFSNRPTLVRGNYILFTDGGAKALERVTLLFKKVFYFACGNFEIKDNKNKNLFILQDDRIYEKCLNSINYVKKINFKKYKKLKEKAEDNVLIYGTKNCRHIEYDMYFEIMELFPDSNFICLTSKENRPSLPSKRFSFPEMPVKNLFLRFNTYVYTPVPRKFDCSSRLLAECKFYNKKVHFFMIDYWDQDKGLYWRNWDIQHQFEKLFLDHGDEIVEILRSQIEL